MPQPSEPSDRGRATLLVVEDDGAMREFLGEELADAGFHVELAGGGLEGVERVRSGGIDVVVSDLRMPDLDGFDLLRDIRAAASPPHVIIITAFGSIDTAIKAVKLGAYTYITKPFEMEALLLAIDQALSERGLRREVERLRREVARPYALDNIVGQSPAMREVLGLVSRLSGSVASVLITGESGTGKEVIAHAVHHHSGRAHAPFVGVNLSAFPESLLEAELFGYRRGAFTDAKVDHEGLFVQAHKGTLFLDEIGELPPPLQAKLLRVLQEREVRPLGASRAERVDVRVIAATHRDLDTELRAGSFREDLYYRLNVVQINLPPLRSRTEDIIPLAELFLAAAVKKNPAQSARSLAAGARRALLAHGWPGNVRELENAIERAVALAVGEAIEAEDFPAPVRERPSPDFLAVAAGRGLSLADLERAYIERVLHDEGGNKSRAAERLGVDRKTLYRKLEEYAASGGQR